MYAHVFVAGTFDGLHKGHIALLTRAFSEGERVTIGLTSDEFVKKFKVQSLKCKVLGYNNRKKELTTWLKKEGFFNRTAIVVIDNPYEPAVSVHGVDALVVSAETRPRGEEINRMRKIKGLAEFILIEVPIVDAVDSMPISSTRIRNGEIDTDGKLIMPETLRKVLHQPMGTILLSASIQASIRQKKGNTIVTVGDMTTKTFLDAGVIPQVMIIDRLVGRNPYDDAKSALRQFPVVFLSVTSGPGYIAKHAMGLIQRICNGQLSGKPQVIVVNGEEDLLVLPVILYAPIGSFVYYGQPPLRPDTDRDYEGQAGQGIVEVEVTKQKKAESKKLLSQFV